MQEKKQPKPKTLNSRTPLVYNKISHSSAVNTLCSHLQDGENKEQSTEPVKAKPMCLLEGEKLPL